jgi:hypothetical protein
VFTSSCAALLLFALTGCASSRPAAPPGVDPAHLHFHETSLGVGDPAPDFRLRRADGLGFVKLSELRGRPVALVFGSYT